MHCLVPFAAAFTVAFVVAACGPGAGGVGTVRIRARFSDDFDVEGEVQLDVCD
jgi:hypothetical protein